MNMEREDTTSYTHPGRGFSLYYPKDFALFVSDHGDDEQSATVSHPTLSLEISIRNYPQGIYAPVLRDARYRGVMWFDAGPWTFDIRKYATYPSLLWTWMDQVLSEGLRLRAGTPAPDAS
jgi:hypothetical protein